MVTDQPLCVSTTLQPNLTTRPQATDELNSFKQQYNIKVPTIGVLPTDEMLMVLQDPPELGIIIDDPLQRLRCQDAAGRLRHQHAHAHLLHERLHTRGQADGRVLMDAHRDPSVHHPAEKTVRRRTRARTELTSPCARALQRSCCA